MMEDLKTKLNSLEYPFKWNPRIYLKKGALSSATKYDLSLTEYPKFFYGLLFAYEYGMEGLWDKSLEELKKCDEIFKTLDPESETVLPWEALGAVASALKDLTNITKAHILLEMGDIDGAKELLEPIEPFEGQTSIYQAWVWATKGRILIEYGVEGSIASVEYMEKAVELDKVTPLWHFFLGKVLMRRRHFEFPSPPPSFRELKHLEIAYSKCPSLDRCMYLFSGYSELAKHILRSNNYVYNEEVDFYHHKTNLLIREGLAMSTGNDDELFFYVRCGRALLDLPDEFEGEQLGLSLLNKAVKKAPDDAMVTHVLGKYYFKKQDWDQAIFYLTISKEGGCFNAAMSLVGAHLKKDPTFDASSIFEQYLAEQTYWGQKLRIHEQAIVYYLLCRRDLPSAFRHFRDGLQIDRKYKGFKHCFQLLVKTRYKFLNLCELMSNELRLLMKEEKYDEISEAEIEAVLKILDDVAPWEVKKLLRPGLIDAILQGELPHNNYSRDKNQDEEKQDYWQKYKTQNNQSHERVGSRIRHDSWRNEDKGGRWRKNSEESECGKSDGGWKGRPEEKGRWRKNSEESEGSGWKGRPEGGRWRRNSEESEGGGSGKMEERWKGRSGDSRNSGWKGRTDERGAKQEDNEPLSWRRGPRNDKDTDNGDSSNALLDSFLKLQPFQNSKN